MAASNGIAIQVDAAMRPTSRPATACCLPSSCAAASARSTTRTRRCSPGCAAGTGAARQIGALCTGAHVLARAGLLDRHRCTIHWENLPGFIEAFPEIPVTSDLYEIDRNRFTCSGGTAALDLMLHRIALAHGDELATKVSEQCIVDRIRGPHDRQRMPLRVRLGVHHPKLIRAVEIMEGNIEEPLSQEIAGRADRPIAPSARAAVPPPSRPYPGPVLSGDAAGAGASPALPDRHADHERGLRHRLRLGLALHNLLPPDVRQDPAGGAGAGGVAMARRRWQAPRSARSPVPGRA